MVIRANELHDEVGCERQETVETVLIHLFGDQNKLSDRENHNVNIMDDNGLPHSSVVTHTVLQLMCKARNATLDVQYASIHTQAHTISSR